MCQRKPTKIPHKSSTTVLRKDHEAAACFPLIKRHSQKLQTRENAPPSLNNLHCCTSNAESGWWWQCSNCTYSPFSFAFSGLGPCPVISSHFQFPCLYLSADNLASNGSNSYLTRFQMKDTVPADMYWWDFSGYSQISGFRSLKQLKWCWDAFWVWSFAFQDSHLNPVHA